MVMAFGVGAWTAGAFHLFTHAFLKALLFLGAGSVSHVVHGFDLERDMGGLRKSMPVTHVTFAIGSAALIGIIPLSGFWSKEQITAQAGANGYVLFQVVALVGTFLTAGYMTRCYYLMFWGKHRGSSHPHESPLTITLPCVALAVATLLIGFLEAPALGIGLFSEWVAPAYLPAAEIGDRSTIDLVFVTELLIAAAGVGLAACALTKGFGPRSLAQRSAPARAMYGLLSNRYYLDWLYDRLVVNGIRRGLSWIVHWVDHNLIDNLVDLVGRSAVGTGVLVNRWFDTGVVDRVVNGTGGIAHRSGSALGHVQSGKVQRYAGVMLGTVTFVAVLLTAMR